MKRSLLIGAALLTLAATVAGQGIIIRRSPRAKPTAARLHININNPEGVEVPAAAFTVTGTADDNSTVASVTVACPACSAVCDPIVGTGASLVWSCAVTLGCAAAPGTLNTITATASDGVGGDADTTDTLTVRCTNPDTADPTISITTAPDFTTTNTSYTIAGEIGDTDGRVTSVVCEACAEDVCVDQTATLLGNPADPSGFTIDLIVSPAGVGAHTITCTATDAASHTATDTLAYTYAVPVQVDLTTAALPVGVESAAYTNATLAAVGGTEPYAFTIVTGSLPTGLSLAEATGAITGTPAEGTSSGGSACTGGGNGCYTVVFRVTDSAAAPTTDDALIVIKVIPAGVTNSRWDEMIRGVNVAGGTVGSTCGRQHDQPCWYNFSAFTSSDGAKSTTAADITTQLAAMKDPSQDYCYPVGVNPPGCSPEMKKYPMSYDAVQNAAMSTRDAAISTNTQHKFIPINVPTTVGQSAFIKFEFMLSDNYRKRDGYPDDMNREKLFKLYSGDTYYQTFRAQYVGGADTAEGRLVDPYQARINITANYTLIDIPTYSWMDTTLGEEQFLPRPNNPPHVAAYTWTMVGYYFKVLSLTTTEPWASRTLRNGATIATKWPNGYIVEMSVWMSDENRDPVKIHDALTIVEPYAPGVTYLKWENDAGQSHTTNPGLMHVWARRIITILNPSGTVDQIGAALMSRPVR